MPWLVTSVELPESRERELEGVGRKPGNRWQGVFFLCKVMRTLNVQSVASTGNIRQRLKNRYHDCIMLIQRSPLGISKACGNLEL
jgi:hypothetical protein